MWMPLIVVASLSLVPGDAGQLAVTHPRFTYGVLGPTRPDGRFLPGDQAVLSFDIEGAKSNDEGQTKTSVALEVLDSNGKVRFKQKPREMESSKCLGGNSIQGVATIDVGLDQPPGEYTVKVTVTDRLANQQASITQTAEVLPAALGVVRMHATTDPEDRIPASAWGVGQSAWINALAVGFSRTNGQPHLVAELRVLDANGQATTAKPYSGEIEKDVPKKTRAIPLQFLLELNRAGSFTAELTVTDKVSGKTATSRFPLHVVKPG